MCWFDKERSLNKGLSYLMLKFHQFLDLLINSFTATARVESFNVTLIKNVGNTRLSCFAKRL